MTQTSALLFGVIWTMHWPRPPDPPVWRVGSISPQTCGSPGRDPHFSQPGELRLQTRWSGRWGGGPGSV